MASSRLSFDHVPAIMRSMWFTLLAVRLTRHWLNQCRIFTYAQPRHVKPILYSQPFGMGIILSAASVCVPFPKLRDLTSRQHCLPAPYVRKNMVLFVFRLCSLTWFQRTLLLGSSHPPLRLSPLLPSGCKADGSRLNQHEVCLSCRGTSAVRNFRTSACASRLHSPHRAI